MHMHLYTSLFLSYFSFILHVLPTQYLCQLLYFVIISLYSFLLASIFDFSFSQKTISIYFSPFTLSYPVHWRVFCHVLLIRKSNYFFFCFLLQMHFRQHIYYQYEQSHLLTDLTFSSILGYILLS